MAGTNPFGPGMGGRGGPHGGSGGGTSPSRYPASRSAGLPRFPAGSRYRLSKEVLRTPPPMPEPAPAGPYDAETSRGVWRMQQTFNDVIAVTTANIQVLPRNYARKGLILVNPHATITVFLDFNNGPASSRKTALLPLNSMQFYIGYYEYIPKEGIFAIASAAGPVSLSVTEFS